MTELYSNMHASVHPSGNILLEWLKSEFIALVERTNREVLRGLPHNKSHLRKVFQKDIRPLRRSDSLQLIWIYEGTRKVNTKIIECLVDYKKTFDCVTHKKKSGKL